MNSRAKRRERAIAETILAEQVRLCDYDGFDDEDDDPICPDCGAGSCDDHDWDCLFCDEEEF